MEFKYKNKKHSIPASLSEITLRQRIEFDKLYSKEIEDLHQSVYKVDEKGDIIEPDEVEVMMMNIAVAVRNFSFFSGIPLKEVEENISIEDVLTVYHSCFRQIYEQQDNLVLQEGYLWNDELWKIEKPELTFESGISFNELIVSKQIVKHMDELGAGHWEAMLYLAAIFLKRENEVFQESWMNPEGERIQMMYDLPMDIAIAVAFFLQISINIYLRTSPYSEDPEPEKVPI